MGLYGSSSRATSNVEKILYSPPVEAILGLLNATPITVGKREEPCSIRIENFAMRIVFTRTGKPSLSLVRLRRDRTMPSKCLEVHLDLFSNKRIVVESIPFLEWLLVSELESFFEMELHEVDYKLQVEYGYYQNDEEVLGAHKQLDEDNFAEEILTIILGYAKHMIK